MDRTNIQEMLINLRESSSEIESTEDESIRVVLEIAVWQAIRMFMKMSELTDEQYLERLPTLPVDMLFYIKMVKLTFQSKDNIIQILSGDVKAADWW